MSYLSKLFKKKNPTDMLDSKFCMIVDGSTECPMIHRYELDGVIKAAICDKYSIYLTRNRSPKYLRCAECLNAKTDSN